MLNRPDAETLAGKAVVLEDCLICTAHRVGKLGGLNIVPTLGNSGEGRWNCRRLIVLNRLHHLPFRGFDDAGIYAQQPLALVAATTQPSNHAGFRAF